MKLTVLSRYPRTGASSRLRTMQYEPHLRAAGLEVEYLSYFDQKYLDQLYGLDKSRPDHLGYFSNRLAQLRQAGSSDCIWLEKEALPWLPYGAEKAFWPNNVPVVTDYDDAIFHRYDAHSNALVRAVFGRKIDRIMAASAAVIAGNDYLAERARKAGARQVENIPTVVDVDNYVPKDYTASDEKVRIVWIGTPSTWSDYMRDHAPLLTDMVRSKNIEFYAIGGGEEVLTHEGLQVLPWSEANEAAQIRRMDIGIMPITDEPFARGKCGYKLIQYMAAALPVVASPMGANNAIVLPQKTGFLADSRSDWRDALNALIDDPALRQAMGRAGRERVESKYSLQSQAPRIIDLFRQVMERRTP